MSPGQKGFDGVTGYLPVDLEHPEGPQFQRHPDKAGDGQLTVKTRLASFRTKSRKTSSLSLA